VSERLSALRARARALPARTVDGILVALVGIGTLIEASLADATVGGSLAALGPASLVAAGLVLRRRAPIGALALAALGLAATNLLDPDVTEALQSEYIATLYIVYWMAGRLTGLRLAAGIGVGLAGVVLISATQNVDLYEGGLLTQILISSGFFLVAPVFAGTLLNSRVRLNEALTEKAELADRDRSARADEAVVAERARIASELHDLVAHALGAMTIQASAARRLAATDTERAASAFEAVEATGRDALGELRTLLEVLREDTPHDGPEPQPTLDSLPLLAERARAAGLDVALDIQGVRPDDLAASIDLTAYRVVQDALRAAHSDGGAGSARVELRFRGDRIDIQVTDDGIRAAGRRLLGLRERVRVYGGEVSTEPQRPGGFRIQARLPLGGAA
jgi:signal transduction histidine kinase